MQQPPPRLTPQLPVSPVRLLGSPPVSPVRLLGSPLARLGHVLSLARLAEHRCSQPFLSSDSYRPGSSRTCEYYYPERPRTNPTNRGSWARALPRRPFVVPYPATGCGLLYYMGHAGFDVRTASATEGTGFPTGRPAWWRSAATDGLRCSCVCLVHPIDRPVEADGIGVAGYGDTVHLPGYGRIVTGRVA